MQTLFKIGEDDFNYNVIELVKMAGCRPELVPVDGVKLTKPTGEELIIKAKKEKFVSILILFYISEFCGNSFTVEGEVYNFIKDFFAPLWDESGHETIDFLREPGVRVEILK